MAENELRERTQAMWDTICDFLHIEETPFYFVDVYLPKEEDRQPAFLTAGGIHADSGSAHVDYVTLSRSLLSKYFAKGKEDKVEVILVHEALHICGFKHNSAYNGIAEFDVLSFEIADHIFREEPLSEWIERLLEGVSP